MKQGRFDTQFIARAGLIAALYVIPFLFPFVREFSFKPGQLRVSEAMCALAYLDPAAIPGLFVGCLVANIIGQAGGVAFGIVDIVGGSLITLVAAYLTWQTGKLFRRFSKAVYGYVGPLVGLLFPVLLNAFGVGAYVSWIGKYPYLPTAFLIGLGELVAIYLLGYPLLIYIMRTKMIEEKKWN